MNEWEPIIDNTKGIIYFKNKINNKIQFDYPKKYNILKEVYEDIFFENWRKEILINNENLLLENQYIWKNIKNGFTQKINPNSTTFILEAALNNNFAFFELFIEYGGNINYLDKLKRNCLHYVAINDNFILAKLLIKLGCKLNKKDIYGISPFLYCIKYFSYKTMKLLIKNNCNINEKDNNGNTALHYAIMNKNTKLIAYLLKHGAKLEIKNKKGKYPIDISIDRNYTKITKILTKHSYLIEDEKFYKLKEFSKTDKYEKLLIKKNKKFEEEDNNNKEIQNKKFIDNTPKSKDGKIKNNFPFFLSKQNNNQNKIKKLNLLQIKNNKILNEDNKNEGINYNKEEKSITYDNEERKCNFKNKENFKRNNKKSIKGYSLNNNNEHIIISSKDNIYNKSFDFIKSCFSLIYLFLVNTIFPYIKQKFIKFYYYSRKKAKKIYKYLKIYTENTYLYYNNTPDIENQIEYLNYSGLSSSIDGLSFRDFNHNNNIKSFDFPHKIRNKLFKNHYIVKTKKNWMKKRKISYFKNNYIYRIPYKLIYNLNDDYPKLNIKKIIKIIRIFYTDKKFIKNISFHFKLNIKKIIFRFIKRKNFIKIANYIDFSYNKETENNELFNFNDLNCPSKNNLFFKEYNYSDINSKKNLSKKSEISQIKINSNNNKLNDIYPDEAEIRHFLFKNDNFNNKNINNLFQNKNFSNKEIENENILNKINILNFNNSKESIYSIKINKTIDNINLMLNEINEIRKNKNVFNNDIKKIKGIKLNNRKNRFKNENNKNFVVESDKNMEKLNEPKKSSNIDKNEILQKILIDYNTELNEIKN